MFTTFAPAARLNNYGFRGLDFDSLLNVASDTKPQIDAKQLSKELSQFTKDSVQDFAKREQDKMIAGTFNARDPNQSEEVKKGQKFGAIAGAAICAATGVGAALLPVCGLVGGFIGGLIGGLFSSPEDRFNEFAKHIQTKYFNPTGDELEGSKGRQIEAIGRVWEAYGVEHMDSLVELILCTRKKGLILPKDAKICANGSDWCGKPILFWYDTNTKRGVYQTVYWLGDWAQKVEAIDNYVAPALTQTMDVLSAILEKDKRCISEVNNQTAKGFALVEMYAKGINTPNLIRKYSSFYDDGQSEAHRQVLDPCSEYTSEAEKRQWEQKTGKKADCPDKTPPNTPPNPALQLGAAQKTMISAAGAGLGIFLINKFL